MKYSDQQRLEKICTTTQKLLAYLNDADITPQRILAEEPVRWAITTPLYNIGEHVYYLSDAFKQTHGSIPWTKIAGLRHRLVHDYDNTNWSLICAVLFEVLPDFQHEVETLSARLEDGCSP